MKPKKGQGPKPDPSIEITKDELTALLERIEQSGLSEADRKLVSSLVATVLTLRTLLDRRTGRLTAILRKIFGLKTEARAKAGRRPESKKSDPSDGKSGRKGGQGRHGKDDYPGAKRITVEHECLKPGDPCPACERVGLTSADDGVAYRWVGQAPLVLTIYLLQRLLCPSCKTTFTAAAPGEQRDRSGLDPSAPDLAGTVKERSYDPSAAAAIASLRFEMGVPHFRLAEVQTQQGVPLAPGTQYKVMADALRIPGEAVFGVLERHAGQEGGLFINDDTNARIMDLERENKAKAEATKAAAGKAKADAPVTKVKPKAKAAAPSGADGAKGAGEPDRKKVQTSAIVVRVGERTICLYYTGRRNAGENLAKVLAHREDGEATPLQMCDGLSANHAKGYKTMLGNCLDHARRKYNDVEARFPEEVAFVLDTLGLVYKNDKDAKARGLTPDERLAWHQQHSAPLMEKLENWAKDGLAEKRIEPNSTLGGAVNYMLKRWLKLTAFLREAGMPLSSVEVERLIKRCIRHRKNSLHYKTQKGAQFGDMLMSLIQTCRYARESAHTYLTALARYKDRVLSEPEKWLPWNYRQALEPPAPS
jgi:transposase